METHGWCEQQQSEQADGKAGTSVTRGYLLLPISHGSISIKFITAFAANGSPRYFLRSAPAMGRSALPLPSQLYSLLDPLYFSFPNAISRITRPLCVYMRHLGHELFPTGDITGLMTDLATDVSWNSS